MNLIGSLEQSYKVHIKKRLEHRSSSQISVNHDSQSDAPSDAPLSPEEKVKIESIRRWVSDTAKEMNLSPEQAEYRQKLFWEVVNLRPTDLLAQHQILKKKVEYWSESHQSDPVAQKLVDNIIHAINEAKFREILFSRFSIEDT